MKNILAAFFVAFLVAQAYAQSTTDAAKPLLIITEIAPFEPSDTEWIEIYNNSGAALDLTGWKFFEEGTNHGLTAFRGDFILDPGEYAVIANKAELAAAHYSLYTGTIFDSSWGSLKEDGEEIGVKDAAGNVIELFAYPSFTSEGVHSLERISLTAPGSDANNWRLSAYANSIGTGTVDITASDVLESTAESSAENGTSTANSELSETPPSGEEEATNSPSPSESSVPQQPTPALQSTTPPPPPPPPPAALPPPNLPPQAVIQIQSGSLTGEGATTINFDGRASYDLNGDPLTFAWDMGDGKAELTANPGPHKYDKPGIYTVTLTVTDARGLYSSAQQVVEVTPKIAPTKPVESAQPTPTAALPSPPVVSPTKPTAIPAKKSSAENTTNMGIPPGFELRGYFVLVQQGDGITNGLSGFAAPVTSPSALAVSANTLVAQKSKTAKKSSSSKKAALFKNGDLSLDVQISEIFPAPQNAEDEWIEIFNAGETPVNLGNWMLADKSKISSPYRLPDTLTLAPGAYHVFPKSDTKIALNNGSDEVFLADFMGSVVDQIAYEKGKKNNSYARVRVGSETEWQWTSEPTPGAPAPALEEIEGTISSLNETAFEIFLPDGEKKKIEFEESVLDSKIAAAVMTVGAKTLVHVEKKEDDSYALKKVASVYPAEQTRGAEGGASVPLLPLILASGAGAGIAAAGPRLLTILKESLKLS